MTTSVLTYQKGTVDREAATKLVDAVVSSSQGSAKVAVIPVSDLAPKAVVSAQIESTTGVFRAPQGVVSVSGSNVTVNDSGLAQNEIIHLQVVGYSVAP